MLLAIAACGSEPPTATHEPEPPVATVEWPALERVYDDPLYRRLPFLLADSSVGRALDGRMSELASAIHARDTGGLREAMGEIHAIREAYAAKPGDHRSETPVLAALVHFELRGGSYVRYDSLHARDALLTTEDAP